MSMKQQIDELIDAFDGAPTALYMNRHDRRQLIAELRALAGARSEKRPAFGGVVEMYRGIPIYVAEGAESVYAVRLS